MIVRISCLGLLKVLESALSGNTQAATMAASVCSTVLYVLVIAGHGKKQFADHRRKFLEGGCPLW